MAQSTSTHHACSQSDRAPHTVTSAACAAATIPAQTEIEECDRLGSSDASVPHDEQLDSWMQVVAASRCVPLCAMGARAKAGTRVGMGIPAGVQTRVCLKACVHESWCGLGGKDHCACTHEHTTTRQHVQRSLACRHALVDAAVQGMWSICANTCSSPQHALWCCASCSCARDVDDAVDPLLSPAADVMPSKPAPPTIAPMPRAGVVSDFAASAGYNPGRGGSVLCAQEGATRR